MMLQSVVASFRQTAILLFAGISLVAGTVSAEDLLPGTVEFNRDIRPILSDTCFHCHGPDQAQRKADLRLDQEEAAFAEHNGFRPLVPNDLEESELYQRIISEEPEYRMPPPNSGHSLSKQQISLIRQWIEQGAKWQKHWAFLPPRSPAIPTVKHAGQIRNPIDAFVLARLEQAGIEPSPEADRNTLIRRLSLDLTGLPPTPAEVDAFLADKSPDAYEAVVDRLLNSPRYGERMAMRWLDAARYADTNGYQSDGERSMWRWRDWVIEAYNSNMSFDQFTIEQLAGDLLPNPTLDQLIATGFNRNHRGNAEGGIIPEEYAVEYVVDRVDTTATVWMGVTMGCARCHDHKYDPFSQVDFYRQFAFFNNVPEKGKAVKFGNSPPMIKAPTVAERNQLAALDAKLAEAAIVWHDLAPEVTTAQIAWEKTVSPEANLDWSVAENLIAHCSFDGTSANLVQPSSEKKSEAKTDTNEPATSDPVKQEPQFVAGMLGQAAKLEGEGFIDLGDVGNFGYYDKFSCAAWIQPSNGSGGTIISRMTDSDRADGYYLTLTDGHVQFNLVKRWLDDSIRVETAATLPPGEWHHVCATYNGSRIAAGIQIYIDGVPQKLTIHLDELNQSFNNKEPLRIGGGGGKEQNFQGNIDEARVYSRALTAEEAELLATRDSVSAIVAIPADERTPAQAHKLRAYFLARQAPDKLQQAHTAVVDHRQKRAALIESFPTTMVMQELPQPRESFVLLRGEYDKFGEPVSPGVPESIAPWPDGLRTDRMGYAQWLLSPEHPLTARVAVNRYWQMYFGNGIVKTMEDFGAQGEWPSHPELLDWLATEFIRSGWDVKQMQKTIVMSGTYRRSSKVTPELLHADPENRLLARGPRLRLSAESIRDQALYVSGLLVEKQGGPSVSPYQPAGLWEEVSGTPYIQDQGDKLYRRSMYTFWKRTVAPPAMLTFDASTRETCTVRETRTNTPLQALTLLNDVTFVEAARVLAQRVLQEADTPETRLDLIFKLVLARTPQPKERMILTRGLAVYRDRFRTDKEAAGKLVATGETAVPDGLDVSELAAYTTLAGLILNLDEAITKE